MSDIWGGPIEDVVDLAFELDNIRDLDDDPRPYEEIFSWMKKAQLLDACLACSGNCEWAWHDCGCGLIENSEFKEKCE